MKWKSIYFNFRTKVSIEFGHHQSLGAHKLKSSMMIVKLGRNMVTKRSRNWACLQTKHLYFFFTLSNAKHGESIIIGFAASATSKGPQVKTTEPMISIKVTNCSIQLGWILACEGFAKNYMGSRPEAKKCNFFIYCVRM